MDRQAPSFRLPRHRDAGRALADQHEAGDVRPLPGEGCSQRPGGEGHAVADTGAAIDHRERERLGEARILQAVIHDDDVGASFGTETGAGRAVAGDDRGSGPGQQQRLVADLRRTMPRGIDDQRPGEAPAIAAAEEGGGSADLAQGSGECQGRRRLAGPAEGEVADAQDRAGRGRAGAVHPVGGQPAVEPAGGREQTGEGVGRRPRPEAGRAHGGLRRARAR